MAKNADRNLLTIGACFIIIVVSVLLYVPLGLLGQWWMVFAVMVALFGVWALALAAMQHSNPEKYGRGAFSYFSWGLLLIALGGAWSLFYLNAIYSIVLVLLVLGALAIAAAFRRR
jgi:cobalamin synthase